MHDHDAIFQHNRVYIPVPQPQHWGLLEVDNINRTITYMDSYRNGGSDFTQVMMDYLVQYEQECNMPARSQWRKRHSMCTATTLWSTLVRVPKQDNGNDCGVFTCLFADLLERGQDIMSAGPSKVPLARERLLSSLHDKIALPLIDLDDINAHRIPSRHQLRYSLVGPLPWFALAQPHTMKLRSPPLRLMMLLCMGTDVAQDQTNTWHLWQSQILH